MDTSKIKIKVVHMCLDFCIPMMTKKCFEFYNFCVNVCDLQNESNI